MTQSSLFFDKLSSCVLLSQLGIRHFKKAWRWVWEKLHKVEVLFLNCFLNNEYFFYSDFISKRYFWIIFFRLDYSITNLLFTIYFFCENSSQLKNSVTWWKKVGVCYIWIYEIYPWQLQNWMCYCVTLLQFFPIVYCTIVAIKIWIK